MLRGILFTTYFTLKIVQTFMYAWSGSCLTEEVILNKEFSIFTPKKFFRRVKNIVMQFTHLIGMETSVLLLLQLLRWHKSH